MLLATMSINNKLFINVLKCVYNAYRLEVFLKSFLFCGWSDTSYDK